MKTPSPHALGYEVRSATRPVFVRCGREFRRDEATFVPAGELTEAQRSFLLNSDPRDLVVVEITERASSHPETHTGDDQDADPPPTEKPRRTRRRRKE